MSCLGLLPGGCSTPSSRVQGKFSIHDACEPSGSTESTIARVRGADHQSCHRSRAPSCPAIQASSAGRPPPLPPCPLTTKKRRKPCSYNEPTTSHSSAP